MSLRDPDDWNADDGWGCLQAIGVWLAGIATVLMAFFV